MSTDEGIARESGLPEEPMEPSRKSRKQVLIFAAIFAAAVLGIAAVLAAVNSGYFLKPREFYLAAEGKYLEQMVRNAKESVKKVYEEEVKPYHERNYSRKRKLGTDVNLEGAGALSQKQVADVISLAKKFQVVINTQNSVKDQKHAGKISLMLEGNTLLDVEGFADKNRLGLSSRALYNKYFLADMEDLNTVYEKFGIRGGPKKLVRYEQIVNTLRFSEEDLELCLKDYGGFLSGLLEEEQFTMRKGVVFQTEDRQRKCNEITITFSEEQVKNLLKQLYGKMVEDSRLLGLTYDNLAGPAKLFLEAGYFDGDPSVKQWVEKSLDKSILQKSGEELEKVLDETGFPDGMKMTVLIDEGKNIVDRKISVKMDKGSQAGVELAIGIQGWQDDRSGKRTTRLEMQRDESINGSHFVFLLKAGSIFLPDEKDQGRKRKIDLTVNRTQDGRELASGGIDLMLSSQVERNTGKKTDEIQFTITNVDSSEILTGKITGSFHTTGSTNEKNKTRNIASDLKVQYEFPNVQELKKADIALHSVREDRFDVDVKLPELNEKNSVDLNAIDQAGLEKLIKELQVSVFGFILKNQAMFGSIFE